MTPPLNGSRASPNDDSSPRRHPKAVRELLGWLQRTRILAEHGLRNRLQKNTAVVAPARRGRVPVALHEPFSAVLDDYAAALTIAPLSDQTRRTYASKVRQYLAWLSVADIDGDPLDTSAARDRAVRDYRTHLQTVLTRKPATVNNALGAVDDLYTRRGLGPASAARAGSHGPHPRRLASGQPCDSCAPSRLARRHVIARSR